MKRNKPILQILADYHGVYEIGVRAPADEYESAERLSAAIKPAIVIIDEAIRDVYAGVKNLRRTCGKGSARSPHGVGE